MDTSTGRDGRFNLGYNMSLLGGDTSPDMYGGHGRSTGASLSPGMSRSGMGGLPGQCAPASGPPRGLKRTSSDVCFLDQDVGRGVGGMDCGSDLMDDGFSPAPQKSGPPPNGKKTKGRVKIKMEYIDNKLRRYTTFSKRKTGIMKKAYELSTLTGTQVMLLVASETGHVYTFATRKLQPMITSEAGKALIQTCLNSPDPCPSSTGGGGGGGDQRMSATGFEETELSYNIGDDEQKQESDDAMPSPRSVDDGDLSGGESSGQESPRAVSPEPPAAPAKFNLPDMIRAGIRNVLQKGGGGGGVLDPPSAPEAHQQTSTSTAVTLSTSSPSLISSPYSGVMYQTAQGLVYATPGTSLPNGVILSLPPGIQLQPHSEPNGNTSSSSSAQAAAAVLRQPQFIRIPFPMALSEPQVSVASQSRNTVSEAADLSKGGRK